MVALISFVVAINIVVAACQDIPPIPFGEDDPNADECDTRGWYTWHSGDMAVRYHPFYMAGASPIYGNLDLYQASPAVEFFTTSYLEDWWVGTGFAGEIYIYTGQPNLDYYFAYWGWSDLLDIMTTTFEGYSAAFATEGSGDDITEYRWVEYGGSVVIGFYSTLYIDPDYDPDGEGALPAPYQLRVDYEAFVCSFTLHYDN